MNARVNPLAAVERDARTIYDIACIRSEGDAATREDVDFRAIALRNFNHAAHVAGVLEAAKRIDKLSLVILSAVHHSDPEMNDRTGVALLDLRAALAPFTEPTE